MKIQTQINQKAYKSGDGFIGHYQKLIKKEVIPYQYEVLKDEAEGAEKSHVVANFINAGKTLRGDNNHDGFYGMVFQDSDAAKWIEAAAYSLTSYADEELENCVDTLINYIADAQDTDGYLNTYYTIKDKDKRWENLLEGHEMYCAGHMMEAACAYYEATGKRKLLDVMEKNAEHIYTHFIENGNEGYPGHPEIELALMKMYRMTGNEHCLKLAKHLIDVRGVDPHFYEKERDKRDWTVWGNDAKDHNYQQSGKPVREQEDATGHAVRAVYLYTGMADIAASTGDETLINACKRLWRSIVDKQMYITGGIGSTVEGEAFSTDYDLPNDTAYCETCASIGLMFFASRMLENEIKGEYADVMERAFYNTVLAGMQLDGKHFFYVNPLECVPGISGKTKPHRHTLTMRPRWYACACCPPNTARLISSFGKYAYGENEDTAFCHMFAEGTVDFENGMQLVCETGYPYDFTVKYKVTSGNGKLAIHIPSWSRRFNIKLNGEDINVSIVDGYLYLDVSEKDNIEVILDDEPFQVYASGRIPRLTNQTAICRGPLVYCFEGVDNEGDVLSLNLAPNANIKVGEKENSLNGAVTLQVEALRSEAISGLYTRDYTLPQKTCAKAIPYYAWCNRGENQMRVWVPLATL